MSTCEQPGVHSAWFLDREAAFFFFPSCVDYVLYNNIEDENEEWMCKDCIFFIHQQLHFLLNLEKFNFTSEYT